MLILAGLGNPGDQYAGNRHNIGFMAVDRIHARHRFGPWKRGWQGETSQGTLAGAPVLLLKPMTYMNESGRSVGEAMRYLKRTPADVVVLHDDLDLPPGKLRMKLGGGHGGHNGLRSITAHIGEDYRRMRLGIGHPGARELVHGYVLSDFARADRDWLERLLDAIANAADDLAKGADQSFANRVHLAMEPEKERPQKPAVDEPSPGREPAGTSPAPEEKNGMAAILKNLLAAKKPPRKGPR
jgi:peptidyl-tRNA hydrolase, PTH1 family